MYIVHKLTGVKGTPQKCPKIYKAGQLEYFILVFYRELGLGGKIDQIEPTCLFLTYFGDEGTPPVKFSQNSSDIVTFLVILSLFGMDHKSPNYLIWWLFSCRLTIQKQ